MRITSEFRQKGECQVAGWSILPRRVNIHLYECRKFMISWLATGNGESVLRGPSNFINFACTIENWRRSPRWDDVYLTQMLLGIVYIFVDETVCRRYFQTQHLYTSELWLDRSHSKERASTDVDVGKLEQNWYFQSFTSRWSTRHCKSNR